MCGIAAIYSYHPVAPEIDRKELVCIRDYMTSRGPDGKGMWCSEDSRVGLAHRRLSIIDLSDKASQPMISDCGNLVISFNGEIYNYRELKKQLENKGHVFQSNSDTEVLLHLYKEKGEAVVYEIRGMFAFALWDGRKGALLLARDPYGIKPLYYADDGGVVRIASQVKALLAGGKVSKMPELAGEVGFFLLGSVPEPYTLFQEIRALPAGSIMWVDENGTSQPKQYFSIAKVWCDAVQNPLHTADAQAYIKEALLDSVKHHLVADVPVGVFLSAGIDSGSIAGLVRDTGYQDIRSVTLGFTAFQGKHQDETVLAQEVAEYYGTHHTLRMVDEPEFRSLLPDIFEAMDQPSIDGINTYLVSKAAAEKGWKVALSGVGGDELFGGYSSFRDIPRWVSTLFLPSFIPFLGEVLRLTLSTLKGIHPKMASVIKYGGTYEGAYLLKRGLFLPEELPQVMDADKATTGMKRLGKLGMIKNTLRPKSKNAYASIATLEASIYMRNQLLRDYDWASMAHSLEIRTPLVDGALLKRLVSTLIALGGNQGKKPLSDSPGKVLPHVVQKRAKSGFTVPIDKWLQRHTDLDIWRKVPLLARENCPWARRWGYIVMQNFAQS